MVHPVEEGEGPPAFVLDGYAGVQQSCSRAVSVTRRSYTIKEKRELVQAIRNGSDADPIFLSCHQDSREEGYENDPCTIFDLRHEESDTRCHG